MKDRNKLYPIFLKVEVLHVLIVGGGKVALEKLTFLLKSSPNAKVTVVSNSFEDGIVDMANNHKVELIRSAYSATFVNDKQLIIAATNDHEVNKEIYRDAKRQNVLINVADTPAYCDFYLGGIVTKGHVKIAISTNGKSPTTAKRLRQFFDDVLPDEINQLVKNLNQYRNSLKGNFENKVSTMNRLTEKLINN